MGFRRGFKEPGDTVNTTKYQKDLMAECLICDSYIEAEWGKYCDSCKPKPKPRKKAIKSALRMSRSKKACEDCGKIRWATNQSKYCRACYMKRASDTFKSIG